MAAKKKSRSTPAPNVEVGGVHPNLGQIIDAAGIGIVRIVAAIEKLAVEAGCIADALEARNEANGVRTKPKGKS